MPVPDIRIRVQTPQGEAVHSIVRPRKLTVKSGFGAMPRRCWLELYDEDLFTPAAIGSILEIEIGGVRVFWGRVNQRRVDSVDDQLTLAAEFDPEREYAADVYGLFEDKTPTGILADILHASPLTLEETHYAPARLSRLEFTGQSRFFAIDLLAKLAGNWIWTAGEGGVLRFRPWPAAPDHIVYLNPDFSAVNLWETADDRFSSAVLLGGAAGDSVYEAAMEFFGLDPAVAGAAVRVYARPITTADVFAALRRAAVAHMRLPSYGRYIDLDGAGWDIRPGDTIRFIPERLPLFPEEAVFRVKEREIVYARETLRVRLWLANGYESAPTYFYYFRYEPARPAASNEGLAGPFQLDVSALDSDAHLDPA